MTNYETMNDERLREIYEQRVNTLMASGCNFRIPGEITLGVPPRQRFLLLKGIKVFDKELERLGGIKQAS